jgi:S1-C subfamily serine protease
MRMLRAAFWVLILMAATVDAAIMLRHGFAPPAPANASYSAQPSFSTELEAAAWAASGLLYRQNTNGDMEMQCTVAAFAREGKIVFLITAAHCVLNDNGRVPDGNPFFVTRDEDGEKLFVPVRVLYVGKKEKGQDFAELAITDTGAAWGVLPLGDERLERIGSPVLTVAAPLGYGKQLFLGSVSALKLIRPSVVEEQGINWSGMLLLDVTIGHGSSGSAVVSVKQRAIIGVLVGLVCDDGSNGQFAVAAPISRFIRKQ